MDNAIKDESQDEPAKQRKNGFMRVSQATLEPDWLLQKIVDFTNQFGISASVTIQVGGSKVTGMTIPASKYMKLFGNSYCSAFDNPEIADALSQLFDGYVKDYLPKAEEDYRPDPVFIHLYDAHFANSDLSFPQNDGKPVLWRGRISSVEGFFLGSAVELKVPPSA